jgi:hypothetical protein
MDDGWSPLQAHDPSAVRDSGKDHAGVRVGERDDAVLNRRRRQALYEFDDLGLARKCLSEL